MKSLPTKILIVEDDSDDEALLMRQLEKADLHTQVKVIADGGEALAFLLDKKHECENLVAIFLDLQLPNLTGLQLLTAIRTLDRTKSLPVILMTSSNDPRDLERCRTLGVSAFVSKPVKFSAFVNAVAGTFHANKNGSKAI